MTNKALSKTRMGQVAAVLMFALAVTFALAQAAMTRDASTIDVVTNDTGTYLVDAAGMALYVFAPDAQGPSTCYDGCATNWPPVTVDSPDALPTAGEGIDAEHFGTVERDDGTFQLTYNDWPLYYFANDMEPGQVNGQGVGGNWFLISDAGEAIGMQ